MSSNAEEIPVTADYIMEYRGFTDENNRVLPARTLRKAPPELVFIREDTGDEFAVQVTERNAKILRQFCEDVSRAYQGLKPVRDMTDTEKLTHYAGKLAQWAKEHWFTSATFLVLSAWFIYSLVR